MTRKSRAVLRYLLLALLIFFILRAARNLWRALRGHYDPPRMSDGNGHTDAESWGRSSGTSAPGRSEYDYGPPDIEDAKWEDL